MNKYVKLIIQNYQDFTNTKEFRSVLNKLIGPKQNGHYLNIFYREIMLGLNLRNPLLICRGISYALKRTRNHKKIYKILEVLIQSIFLTENKNKNCLIIRFNGKISGNSRAKSSILQVGNNMPVQNFSERVIYDKLYAYTYTGVISIQVWLY